MILFLFLALFLIAAMWVCDATARNARDAAWRRWADRKYVGLAPDGLDYEGNAPTKRPVRRDYLID